MSDNDIVLVSPEPATHWARRSDPWTSKVAGADGFPTLRNRCVLLIWLYLDDQPFTAEDISRLCEEPELRRVFGPLPLGKSPWHRITDCLEKGWIEWVVDDQQRLVARMENAGQPQGLRRLTLLGSAVARELWEAAA
jgi:hypothetical protein